MDAMTSNESFLKHNVAKKMMEKGYSTQQIVDGCNAALLAYRNKVPHAKGKLFAACLDKALSAVGKPIKH